MYVAYIVVLPFAGCPYIMNNKIKDKLNIGHDRVIYPAIDIGTTWPCAPPCRLTIIKYIIAICV